MRDIWPLPSAAAPQHEMLLIHRRFNKDMHKTQRGEALEYWVCIPRQGHSHWWARPPIPPARGLPLGEVME